MDKILVIVMAFFQDPRVMTLLGLILLDLLLGVARALRERTFAWQVLAQFYQTMVLPYLIGYLAFYLTAKIVTAELLGPAGWMVGEATVMLAWLTLVGTLGESILANAKVLGYKLRE